MENVSDILLWYKKNFRELPWRSTTDPYKIWLSEIILQQTQVVQGLAYFDRFILKYPKIQDLAKATEEEVLKMWQGLGYYTRARNLHRTARIISDEYQGKFPDNYMILSKLPGIGDYTASAILSFAFGQSYPVLDGNVFRLISRLYDIHSPVNEPKSRPIFKNVLNELIAGTNPSEFNNAIMELGALVCRPENPRCGECPVKIHCLARLNGTVEQVPVKLKKAKHSVRHFNYFYIPENNYFYLIKREKKDIWKNLYQLPLIESDHEVDEKHMPGLLSSEWSVNKNYSLKMQSQAKHLLSHQTIFATFWELRADNAPVFVNEAYKRVNLKNYTKYPIPVLIENFLLSL